jgi:hypothetical protein
VKPALLFLLFCSLSFAQVFPAGNRAATPQDIGVVKDAATTTLTAPIGPQDGVIPVVDGSKFEPFNIITFTATGEKTMICSSTAISLTVCPGARGFDDTPATGHATLETVSVLINDTYFKLRDQELLALEAAYFSAGTDVTIVNGQLQMTFNPSATANPGQQARSVNSKLGETPSITDFSGIVCDGLTDNAAALQALATSAGLATILVPKGVCAVASTMTIPATVALSFSAGGMLAPAAGTTLTIGGPITSQPNSQIFSGEGSVVLVHPGRSINPHWFPGSDIGVRINAAYAACGSTPTSCILELSPNGAYSFSTPIQVPGGFYSELDAHGATLTWTATTGNAIEVAAGGTAPYISGKISNLFLNGVAGVNTNGIHVTSRLGFIFENLRVQNFNGSGAYCLGYDNAAGAFNQQNTIRKADFYNCTKAIRMWVTDGTNSFAYNNFTDVHLGIKDGQYGFSVEGTGSTQSAFVAGGFYDLRVNFNTPTTAGRLINLQNGASWERSLVNVTGEHTSGVPNYGVFSDSTSDMYVQGNYVVSGVTNNQLGASTGSSVIHPALNFNGAVHFEQSGSTLQQRHCKYDLGPTNATFWLASYSGTEDNCAFWIARRNTDNTNKDVDVQGTGSAPVNVFVADSQTGNIGIGPGFSPATPAAQPVDINGNVRVQQDLILGAGSFQTHVATGIANGDLSFQVTIVAGQTQITRAFNRQWGAAPNCIASPLSLVLGAGGTGSGSWAATATNAAATVGISNTQAGNVVFNVHCIGNPN